MKIASNLENPNMVSIVCRLCKAADKKPDTVQCYTGPDDNGIHMTLQEAALGCASFMEDHMAQEHSE